MIIGLAVCFGLYVMELAMWGSHHWMVWMGFAVFGSLSVVHGIYSYPAWRQLKPVKQVAGGSSAT